jgi:drug/metabolite transporter (DMT)-like permease
MSSDENSTATAAAAKAAGRPAPDTLKASLLMLLVATITAVDTAIVRVLGSDLHTLEIVFYRTLFGLLAVAPWLWRHRLGLGRTANFRLHLGRALLKLLALLAFFQAIQGAPLASVTAIAFTTPLFVAVGAALVLGERLPALRIGAIVTGFLGVLVIVRPGPSLVEPALVYALAGAVGIAAIALMLKFLSGRDAPSTIVGLNLILSVPLAFVMALPVLTLPGLPTLALLACQGAAGAVSMTAVTRAMKLADASFLSPIEFVRLPLVALIAYLAFGEIADGWTWLGGGIIFAAVVALTQSERRRPDGAAVETAGKGD